MEAALSLKRDLLIDALRKTGSCMVALSGGVDSAVVAKAAAVALGDRAVAFTGRSGSLADGELETAEVVADVARIRHIVESTFEMRRPEYVQNAPDRCFHCKSELYERMQAVAADLGIEVLVNGANADDLSDYRPGMRAAGQAHVYSPLAECGITKDEVRQLARHWDLPVWDKPAAPCLASRIAYGEEVTPERLRMIDGAETSLKKLGFRSLRVRYHRGDLARIEIPLSEMPRFLNRETHEQIVSHFKRLGFKFITLDLEGFRSGSLNQLVSIDSIDQFSGGM